MFRTVSQIRAGNGRSFIAENASASSNEGHARSERRREALVANAKDFSGFWGHHVDLLEEHREECVSGTLFLQWATRKSSAVRALGPPQNGAQNRPSPAL